MAVRWAYLIRNRNHWNKSEEATVCAALREQVAGLGHKLEDFQRILDCRLIEVEIPYRNETVGWEARIMPWEFVLTNLILAVRDGNPPVVFRRLKVSGRKSISKRAQAGRLAYIQSAPGPLEDFYGFKKERRLVRNSLRSTEWLKEYTEIVDPTIEELQARLTAFLPDVIHVTGIDNHQGAELLREKDSRFEDGIYLSENRKRDRATPVPAEDVASAIVSDRCRPKLVGLNTYNSAPRLAPLIVFAGAASVVAFQDVIDDTLAELFFADFYRAWSSNSGDALTAFENTLRDLRKSSGLTLSGTGLVLWSAESLVSLDACKQSMNSYESVATISDIDSGQPLDQQIEIDIHHREDVNYSLLHNGRNLFQRLYLVNRTGKRLEGLQVKVRLYVGQDSEEQTTRVTIAGPGVDLRTHVSMPLLSRQLRCFRESILSSLKLTVEWEGRIIADRNLRVRILPMNEWCDSDEERQWLPSFVQPLDPAVSQILAAAERHLRTITGDPYAGFDGYQQVEDVSEPNLSRVDQQVEAIWDAVLHDFALVYVNPPPTYTVESQRIRTPSEVLNAARGTCLDLTVLLASCLEHIEIYPAIILLKGHAFPAYWQSPELYKEFWGDAESAIEEAIDFDPAHARGRLDDQHHRFLWMTRGSGYSRLVKAVASRHLVPFESVWITSREPFASACEVGGENLVDRKEFECLIDIHRARECHVLPLPEKD